MSNLTYHFESNHQGFQVTLFEDGKFKVMHNFPRIREALELVKDLRACGIEEALKKGDGKPLDPPNYWNYDNPEYQNLK
jgi:hypothetical protein